jgi:hypothetical protein
LNFAFCPLRLSAYFGKSLNMKKMETNIKVANPGGGGGIAVFVFFALAFAFVVQTCHAQIWQNFKGVRLVNQLDSTQVLSVDGSIYYNEQSNKFRAMQDGQWHDLISGGGSGGAFWPLSGTGELTGDVLMTSLSSTSGIFFGDGIDDPRQFDVNALNSINVSAGTDINMNAANTFAVNTNTLRINYNDGGLFSGAFQFEPFTYSRWDISDGASSSSQEMTPYSLDINTPTLNVVSTSDIRLQADSSPGNPGFVLTSDGHYQITSANLNISNVQWNYLNEFWYSNSTNLASVGPQTGNDQVAGVVVYGTNGSGTVRSVTLETFKTGTDYAAQIETDNSNLYIVAPVIIIPTLPTACTGLPAGAIWNDGGTLKVCP